MFDRLIEILKANPRKIVFTEGPDARILEAADRLKKGGFLTPILIGAPEEVKAAAAKGGFDIEGLEIIDPATYPGMDEMVEKMVVLRKGKMTAEQCREALSKGNYFGTMLVKMGYADALLGGATYSTADTVRPALQLVKTKPGAHLVSSCFILVRGEEKLAMGDSRINNMERDIEHRCMTLLLRQQPVAGDLRRISTAMKVVTDIERIGDHAADIAEIIPHLVTVRKEGDPAVSQAIAMGRKAYQMILDALAALTNEDELAARQVIAADDAVDYDFNAIKHTLAQEIAANPAKVDAALDLLMVIKYLERIGDHAVNVAEWVQFVRSGRYKDESMF